MMVGGCESLFISVVVATVAVVAGVAIIKLAAGRPYGLNLRECVIAGACLVLLTGGMWFSLPVVH